MKNFIINLLKISVSVAILAFLFYQAKNTTTFDDQLGKEANVFDNLMNTSKDWSYLTLAFFCCTAGVVLTFIRWHFLNRALGFNVHWLDSLRIGFIGYLFNLAPVGGIVGGDLLKAWILAKEQEKLEKSQLDTTEAKPTSRIPEALATVFTDRLFGLYSLFLLAAIAIFVSGFDKIDNQTIKNICYGTYIIAVVWTVLIGVILGPDFTNGKSIAALGRLPYIGQGVKRTVESIRLFQKHIVTLIVVTLMGLIIHAFFASCIFLTGAGLFERMHSLQTHLVITPLSMSTGAIPLSVGPFEWVLDLFYSAVHLDGGTGLIKGSGLIVALAYRFMTLILAGFGLIYYFSGKQEISALQSEMANNKQ